MDAIPLGKGLIQDSSCVLLMREENIGIKNSKEKANRLAMNKFLAILDFQETAIAPIALTTITKPLQSKVSETSENTIALSEVPRTPFK
jgi:hypothetical protein